MELVERSILVPQKEILLDIYRSILKAKSRVHRLAISSEPDRLASAADVISSYTQSALTEADSSLDIYFVADDEAETSDYEGKQDTLPGVVDGATSGDGKIIITLSYYTLYSSADFEDWKQFCKNILYSLEHELIHVEQYSRDKRTLQQKEQDDAKEFTYSQYLAVPAEITAFSWSAYRELRSHLSPKEIIQYFKTNIQELLDNSETFSLYYDIFGPKSETSNPKVWKRFASMISLLATKAKVKG